MAAEVPAVAARKTAGVARLPAFVMPGPLAQRNRSKPQTEQDWTAIIDASFLAELPAWLSGHRRKPLRPASQGQPVALTG